ncbi:MAG: polysaccharide biosynthesis C-terminal domain-containing protein [Thermoplasmata archaeon]|nr:polysaccharide biosynthesis C-terminal domain-containing protein [Thermoplasmata archaeon]MCI4344379.1 polysaccharide biosynthesis C-terminal domain-containing protein [Thermoplasmata archaeon]
METTDERPSPGVIVTEPSLPSPARGLGISSTGVFVISILVQLIGYASTFFLARGPGTTPDGRALIGTVGLFVLIASSVTSIGDLRIGTAFTYFVARGRPVGPSTGTYFVLRLSMVGVSGLAIYLLAVPAGLATGTSELGILGVYMILPVIWSVSTVYTQLWIALGDSIRAQYPVLLESIVRTAALITVVLIGPNLWNLTIAYLLGALASTAISLPSVLAKAGRPHRSEATSMFRYATPLMGSMFLLFTATTAVLFLVYADQGRALGNVFNSENGFRILILQLPTAVTVPLFPLLAGLHVRKKFEEIRQQTWRALRYTSMLVIPGVIALTVYRVNIINILLTGQYLRLSAGAPIALGPFVISGAIPMAILAISAFPLALSQLIGTSLNAIGRQRLELYLTTVQVVVLFASAFLLMPQRAPGDPLFHGYLGLDGLEAASVAILLSSIAAFAVNAYFMERLMAVRIRPLPIALITVSALASFIAVSRLNAVLPVSRYYVLFGAIAFGFAVYFLVLALTGELSKDDVRLLSRSLGMPTRLGNKLARLCWRDTTLELDRAAPGAAVGLQPPPSG